MEDLANALDIFSKILIQTSIKEGWWHEIRPTNSIADNTPIEFEISGNGNDCIDFVHNFHQGKNAC